MANLAIVFVGPLGQVYFWALVSLTPGRVRKEKLFCSRQDDGKERAWIIDHLVKILDIYIYIHVYGKLSTLFVCKYLYVYIFIFMYIYVYIVWAAVCRYTAVFPSNCCKEVATVKWFQSKYT